jgi:hypothetical protein
LQREKKNTAEMKNDTHPCSREIAPAEFADGFVPTIGEEMADLDGMVPSLDILLSILSVLGHDGCRQGGAE